MGAELPFFSACSGEDTGEDRVICGWLLPAVYMLAGLRIQGEHLMLTVQLMLCLQKVSGSVSFAFSVWHLALLLLCHCTMPAAVAILFVKPEASLTS
jgi:hypothetical protein